jgi:hypothetical protein
LKKMMQIRPKTIQARPNDSSSFRPGFRVPGLFSHQVKLFMDRIISRFAISEIRY